MIMLQLIELLFACSAKHIKLIKWNDIHHHLELLRVHSLQVLIGQLIFDLLSPLQLSCCSVLDGVSVQAAFNKQAFPVSVVHRAPVNLVTRIANACFELEIRALEVSQWNNEVLMIVQKLSAFNQAI